MPGLVGLGTLAILWVAIDPLAGATNDTDSTAYALYFVRLVSGHRLEAFVPTTPKPLLTIVYGLAWALSHDWRVLTVLTVVVGAAGVACAAQLCLRFGGLAAAACVSVALVLWPDFQLEVSHANSVIWALALALLAGLWISGRPRRPWLAGLALLAATLVRPEAFWLVGAALLGLLAGWMGARLRGSTWEGRGSLPLLLGTLGLPLTCLHDWLLTGSPSYWLSVASGYTALAYPGLPRVGLHAFATELLTRYRPEVAVLVLASLGLVRLALLRRPGLAFGLLAVVAGVMATIALLGLRRIFVSERYFEEVDLPIIIAAAIGAGGVATLASRAWAAGRLGLRLVSWRGLLARAGPPLLVAGGALAGALMVLPSEGPGTLATELGRDRQADSALRSAMPWLSTALRGSGGSTSSVAGVAYPVANLVSSRVYVPRSLIPRISLEADAPLTAIGDSYLALRSTAHPPPWQPGQWVLHIAAADGARGIFAPFEVASPTFLGDADPRILVRPFSVDPSAGLWIDYLDRPSPSARRPGPDRA